MPEKTPQDTAATSLGDTDASPMEVAREKFTHVAEDLKGRYERATGGLHRRAVAARNELHDSAESVKEHYDEAGERLRETYDQAQDRAADLNDDVNDYLLENPGRALLVAAGVGFLLGLALRRR